MSRKAQGLSMNVIIIAAIALLVLVILAIIFIGRMGTTTKGIDACKGSCVSDAENDCSGVYQRVDPLGKCDEGFDCCISVGS
ncbi:hypothetical protein HQ545_01050 [Candidatus Woesearchaeota archaeon]|nr:hypothetical protein [Candidatus Woesearchaeota archaeon]